jgi:hypothetical protein
MSFRKLTEEEWPTWNVQSTTPPVITIEGRDIQSVFSMVNRQLETLRKMVIDQEKALKDAFKREEITKDRHAVQVTKLNSRIDGLQNKISDGDVGKMENRLLQAENKIMVLERQVCMEKDSALQTALASQKEVSSGNSSRLDDLEIRIAEVKEGSINSQRVIDCEAKISGLSASRTDLHGRVVHLEDGQAWFSNQATKMNDNYADLLKNHDVSMREINQLQTEVYEKHTPDIKKLFEEKMDNNDELQTILKSHEDNEEENARILAKLESLLGELDRRVLLLGSECRDDLDTMKHKTDKKIDFLHKWIVKYVGTALKDENMGNETDIGTIRCLVCNHPSKKMDTDTPFVVPDFRNTMGYFHDENNEYAHAGQATSPIRDPKYRTQASPPRSRGHPSQSQQQLPQQQQQEGTKSSSKFAKMRSVPSNSAEYVDEYTNNFVDRVDITEERYSGPRTIGDPKTVAFYNDMTRFVELLLSLQMNKHTERVEYLCACVQVSVCLFVSNRMYVSPCHVAYTTILDLTVFSIFLLLQAIQPRAL